MDDFSEVEFTSSVLYSFKGYAGSIVEECSYGNQTLTGHAANIDARASNYGPPCHILTNHRGLHSETVRLDCRSERRGTLPYDYKLILLREQSPLQHIASEEVAGVVPEVVIYDL